MFHVNPAGIAVDAEASNRFFVDDPWRSDVLKTRVKREGNLPRLGQDTREAGV
jgi:hypothetical protein